MNWVEIVHNSRIPLNNYSYAPKSSGGNTQMKNDFLDTTVILPAKNVRETANFYEEKLGFEINGIKSCRPRKTEAVTSFKGLSYFWLTSEDTNRI